MRTVAGGLHGAAGTRRGILMGCVRLRPHVVSHGHGGAGTKWHTRKSSIGFIFQRQKKYTKNEAEKDQPYFFEIVGGKMPNDAGDINQYSECMKKKRPEKLSSSPPCIEFFLTPSLYLLEKVPSVLIHTAWVIGFFRSPRRW